MVDLFSLLDNLRTAGASVEPVGEISQPFFSVKGFVVKVNGEEIRTFEYTDTAAADSEVALVSPDGNSIGTKMVAWVAPPHFYRRGRLIVLYVGDNTALTDMLENVLGPQFAGR